MIKDYFKYYRMGRKFIFRSSLHRWMKMRLLMSPFFNIATAFNVYCQWEQDCDEAFINGLKNAEQKRCVRTDLQFKSSGATFIPKIYMKKDIDSRLTGMISFSEVRRNYATLCYLFENGIKVPLPLMIVEVFQTGMFAGAVLFIEKLPPEAVDYKQNLHTFSQKPIAQRLAFLQKVAASLADLHNLGVYTEDTDKNMAFKMDGDHPLFYYFDFDNFYPWRVPIFRRTAHAVRHYLLRGIHPFSELEIKTFVGAYVKQRGCPPDWEEKLLKNIEERYPELSLVAA